MTLLEKNITLTSGYKYELSLILNGTVPLPDLTQLEQQVFKMFRTPTLPSRVCTFTPSPVSTHRSQSSSYNPATPLSPFKTPLPSHSPRSAKDRGTKDHFNYLLLDPRVLDRLHSGDDGDVKVASELDTFRVFVESIFYVGKGKNSRSMQHLRDAKDTFSSGKTKVNEFLGEVDYESVLCVMKFKMCTAVFAPECLEWKSKAAVTF